jgi:Transposase DDE domain
MMVERAGVQGKRQDREGAGILRVRRSVRRRQRRQHLLAQRALKRGRRRQRHKNRHYHAFGHLTRNQQEVARRLSAGQVDLVTLTGWGFVANFLAFLDQLEYCVLLDLEGQGFVRVMIPIARLLLTYHLKILLGIPSMNRVPTRLFREIALLQLIGYTTTQLQSGFCQRGNLAVGPMHKNTLADALDKLTAEELERVLNGTARRLVARGFFAKSKGCFALDASDLPTPPTYTGRGMVTQTHKKLTKDQQVVEIAEHVFGFQVFVVYEVHLRLIVAAKVVPIQERETRHTLDLVRQAMGNLGPDILRILLVDRGFLDGADLWTLKHTWGIDFVVPSKATMHVTRDAQALARQEADSELIFPAHRDGILKYGTDGRERWEGQVTVVGVASLTSFDQYGDADHAQRANRKDFVGNPLGALVVLRWQGEASSPGEEKVFLTSLPVSSPLMILDLYDLRSLIENTAFRELKQGWGLENYPKKTEEAVRAHVVLTLLTFTLAHAFSTTIGQTLAHHGIRRQRAEQYSSKVVLIAGDSYAIFEIEEVFILLGIIPSHCFQVDPSQVRKRYASSLPA